MHTLVKKSLSLFFALTLLFSPLAAPLIAPKAEAQLGGAIAGCLSGYLTGLIGAFLSFFEVSVSNAKGDIKECMDAIGWALAKTLLAKLTDSIINWINNGFDGNPFYIGDPGSFFKNIIKDELKIALDDLKRIGNYYFDIMRQEAILKARTTLRDKLDSNLDADIVRGLCGYAEYEAEEFCSQQLSPESRYELSRSFTEGYIPFQWSTWDSLTQNCGNNYFCSGTAALNYQLDLRQERIQNENNTLNRSGGFLNQEVCKDPGFERDLADWQAEIDSYSAPTTGDDFVGPPEPGTEIDPSTLPEKPVCREKIIRTPGRMIADKLTHSLGTNDRQLELADELNESIAAIFDALIGKLIKDGLASFKNSDADFDEDGNYTGDDEYYRANFSENNGFEYDNINTILEKDPEACEAASGTFDEELEVCVFPEDSETAGPPQFPWTMSDGTIIEDDQGFATLINANPAKCIQIDELRIKEGAEPCLTGTSSGGGDDGGDNGDNGDTGGIGDATLTISPSTLIVGGRTTFTINKGPISSIFEVVYRLNDDSDLEFLTSGTTDGTGSGSTTTTTPNITASEVTIIVDFDGETIKQTVPVRR